MNHTPTDNRRFRPFAAIIPVAALALVLAASASAAVYIYANPFKSKSDYREIDRVTGSKSACDKTRAKNGGLKVTVKKDVLCTFAPALTADRSQPDHQVDMTAKMFPKMARAAKRRSFLAVRARNGEGSHYELKIWPKISKYKLSRSPDVGALPIQGKDPAIKKLGEVNKLRLRADGARIRGYANGKKLVDFTDPNPDAVGGRSISFGIGTTQDVNNSPGGIVRKVRVGVPRP